MKETDTKRYFRFLRRLLWIVIPFFGVAVILDFTWNGAPDLLRMLGIAALAGCVVASVTTYRK